MSKEAERARFEIAMLEEAMHNEEINIADAQARIAELLKLIKQ